MIKCSRLYYKEESTEFHPICTCLVSRDMYRDVRNWRIQAKLKPTNKYDIYNNTIGLYNTRINVKKQNFIYKQNCKLTPFYLVHAVVYSHPFPSLSVLG